MKLTSPDNYMMMDYDGHADMDETIQMFLPVVARMAQAI
jgi:hypothetical protein